MNTVRFGIIGIGNMGSAHALNLAAGKVKEAVLSCVCDIDPQRRQWAKEKLPADVEIFDDAEKMIAQGRMDAVIIAVPHYYHPVYAKIAFSKGLNVLTEKPAGVFTKAVREMNEAAAVSGKLFGIMYNQRTNPVYKKVRSLLQSGELGQVKRIIWIITDWYRSQSYYNSSSWRATWSGEGGGVLLNQCPHQLDLWQWMCGMPDEIRSFMRYGVERDIEVENDVTTYFKYPNGATGVFIASTHDTPGTNRLEISADMGKLVVEENKITYIRNKIGEKEFNETWKNGFGQPETETIDIPVEKEDFDEHVAILQNYTNALLHGEELIAPGKDGIKGLSISNAMHLSDWTDHSPVDPNHIDEDLFVKLLQEHIQKSTFVKTTEKQVLDTEGSY